MAIGSATRHPLVEAALALEPRIRASADRVEREGRLPDELVRAISEAGIFRMLVPRALGGSSVYRGSPLQRSFRDIHTASQHSVVSPGSFELIGQALLTESGLDRATGRPLL